MNVLWAPWRIEYVRGPKQDGCLLCEAPGAGDDRARHILLRGGRVFVILNTFPYNSGHLMVAPFRHVARLDGLDAEEQVELMATTSLAVRALEASLSPEGFNLGLNLGRVAGAGIEQHLHLHVVPRWVGDTNFMPVLGAAKVIPEHLDETSERLRTALTTLASGGRSAFPSSPPPASPPSSSSNPPPG